LYLRSVYPSIQSINYSDEATLMCQGHVDICNKLLLGTEKSKQAIIPVEPNLMNERLSLQQGLFLFPADISADFVSSLRVKTPEGVQHPNGKSAAESFDQARNWLIHPYIDEVSAIKFVVPYSLHTRIRHFLWSCNINAQSLFPGLDGFARSLWHWSTLNWSQ